MLKKTKTPKKSRKGSKARKIAENIILVALVGIMLVCAYNIFVILKAYRENGNAYKTVSSVAGTKEFTGNVDFAKLENLNEDVVAWLYYKDTKINYPIVQGTDNNKYLSTRFDGNYSAGGTLFVEYSIKKPFNHFNTVVYGHHMRDGSMFGDLKKLKDEDYAKEHPRFELITKKGKYHLDIWAFLNEPADCPLYNTNIDSEEQRQKYIDDVGKLAQYRTDVKVKPSDKLVVLSTCAYEYEDARYIVIGKLTPWSKKELKEAKLADISGNK